MASTKVSAVQLQCHNNPYNIYAIVLVVSINNKCNVFLLILLTKLHTG